MSRLCILFFLLPLFSEAQRVTKYRGKYDLEDLQKVPAAPNYDRLDYWIAHPEKVDMADLVPGKGELQQYQETSDVDVFFIYPTIYQGKQDKDHPWFADVNDKKLNKKIGETTIKNQASVFNSVGKIYSPLYRQAHLNVYYAGDLKLKVEALEFAYTDVRRAFQYYLENWNDGRPVIIASHSQGTTHAVSLLREFFENRPLMKQLVAAYIVGMPLAIDTFSDIPICDESGDTGCWLTWNTFRRDYYPPGHDYLYRRALNVNPLSWTIDSAYVSWGQNKGGVLRNFRKILPGLSDAQNVDGMLWINKPRFFGNFLINWDRYHIADYNLFYLNIRENAEERVEKYLNHYPEKQSTPEIR